ncbi:MAG: alpha/beta hydrolase [bacterium]
MVLGFIDRIVNNLWSSGSRILQLSGQVTSVPRSTFKTYSDSPDADDLYHVETDDGLEIGIWRYRSTSKDGPSEPVLLVHGLGANHRNLALDKENGLAQYLSERGYDCWAVDLRGRGASDSPRTDWTFDDYVEYDLPAVINFILETTGSKKLHWVGHSMGGMLYYAITGSTDYSSKIATGVTLASPVDFPRPSLVERLASLLHGLPIAARIRTTGILSRFLVTVLGFLPQTIVNYLYNPRNMDHQTLLKAATLASAGTSSQVLTQFPKWFVENHWMARDKRTDYRAGVSSIDVPTLVIAGAVDNLSPHEHIKSGYDDIKTREKRFVLAGKISGYDHNYSHIDLVFGKHARDEIFPLIFDWLYRHPVEKAA